MSERRRTGTTPPRGLRKKPQPVGVFDRPGHSEMVLGAFRDQLSMLTTRTALEAWLANPATQRTLEDLRFTPSHSGEYAQLLGEIEAAREWSVDDRKETP